MFEISLFSLLAAQTCGEGNRTQNGVILAIFFRILYIQGCGTALLVTAQQFGPRCLLLARGVHFYLRGFKTHIQRRLRPGNGRNVPLTFLMVELAYDDMPFQRCLGPTVLFRRTVRPKLACRGFSPHFSGL